jgi:hypothetical protein
VLLYRHDSVVVGAIEEYDGSVIKTIRDSVMAQFEDPLHAVRAAIAMQQRLLEHNRNLPPNERIQIRIGINSGFGFRRSNDLFGDSVNVAARITKRCGPAQILVSHSVFQRSIRHGCVVQVHWQSRFAGKTEAEEIHESCLARSGRLQGAAHQPERDRKGFSESHPFYWNDAGQGPPVRRCSFDKNYRACRGVSLARCGNVCQPCRHEAATSSASRASRRGTQRTNSSRGN